MKTLALTVSLVASVLAGAVAAQAATYQTNGHFDAGKLFADVASHNSQ